MDGNSGFLVTLTFQKVKELYLEMSTLNILRLTQRCTFFFPDYKQTGHWEGAARFPMPSLDLPGWCHLLPLGSPPLLVLLVLSPSDLRAFALAVPLPGLQRHSYSRPALQEGPPSSPLLLHPETPCPSGMFASWGLSEMGLIIVLQLDFDLCLPSNAGP